METSKGNDKSLKGSALGLAPLVAVSNSMFGRSVVKKMGPVMSSLFKIFYSDFFCIFSFFRFSFLACRSDNVVGGNVYGIVVDDAIVLVDVVVTGGVAAVVAGSATGLVTALVVAFCEKLFVIGFEVSNVSLVVGVVKDEETIFTVVG